MAVPGGDRGALVDHFRLAERGHRTLVESRQVRRQQSQSMGIVPEQIAFDQHVGDVVRGIGARPAPVSRLGRRHQRLGLVARAGRILARGGHGALRISFHRTTLIGLKRWATARTVLGRERSIAVKAAMRRSVDGAAAGQVEHRAGRERAVLARQPGDHAPRSPRPVPKRPIGIFDSMKSMCCWVIWSKIAVLTAAGVTQLTRMPVLRELLAERLGQPDDGGLRRRVGRRVRIAFLAGDRGDVDDPAVVPLASCRRRPRGCSRKMPCRLTSNTLRQSSNAVVRRRSCSAR